MPILSHCASAPFLCGCQDTTNLLYNARGHDALKIPRGSQLLIKGFQRHRVHSFKC